MKGQRDKKQYQDIGIVSAFLIPCIVLLVYRFTIDAHICDDAYITFKVALNAATGNGLAFNAAEKVYVVTCPLWAMILALGRIISHDMIQVAKFFGIIFELLFLCSVVQLGYEITHRRVSGVFWAILIVTNPVYLLTSFSGMELSLYLFLLTLSFIFLLRGNHSLSLILAAVSIWARFDGVLIYIISAGWVLITLRNEILKSPAKILRTLSPSIIIIAGYMLFGYFYYGEIIPASAQVKAGLAPELFSEQWQKGAKEIAFQTYNAFKGQSAYWYQTITPYWIMIIPFFMGIVKIILSRNSKTLPMILFTVLYSLTLILSGVMAARNSPWYFAPPLMGIYLLCAIGFAWLISLFINRTFSSPSKSLYKTMIVSFALMWSLILFLSLARASDNLFWLNREREMAYKTAVKWLSEVLDEDSVVGANEIGAIGFYAREDISILDLSGLLRTREERYVKYPELLQKYKPDAFLIRKHFRHPEQIDKIMPGEYEWHKLRTLMIGVRRDIRENSDSDFEMLKDLYRDDFN